MNCQPHVDEIRSFAALRAIALPGSAIPAAAAQAGDTMPAREPVAGSRTGQPIAGVPVYRLPPVEVVTSRRFELERIAREELAIRETHARWKAPRPAV